MSYEREILSVIADSLATRAGEITQSMSERFSREPLLNVLSSLAFTNLPQIAVTEVPYAQLGLRGSRARADLVIREPDDSKRVIIEAKQVHGWTQDSYRKRAEKHGHSVAGDIAKLGRLPKRKWQSRIVLIYMTNWDVDEPPAYWIDWLHEGVGPSIRWLSLKPKHEPLFEIGDGGWFSLYYHCIR